MHTQGRTPASVSLALSQARAAFQRGEFADYRPLQSLKSAGSPGAPLASWGPMMKK
jgi:hypothetical protein